jgi:hypothetical protein
MTCKPRMAISRFATRERLELDTGKRALICRLLLETRGGVTLPLY